MLSRVNLLLQRLRILGIFLSILCGTLPVRVLAFDEVPPGARPTSMGKAFVSVENDGLSFFYNPGGNGPSQKMILTGNYNVLYRGLNTDNLRKYSGSLVYPVKHFSKPFVMSFGWDLLNSKLLNESLLALNLSTDLKNFMDIQSSLYAGINIKWLHRSFTQNQYTAIDPVFQGNGNRINKVSIDAGIFYPVNEKMRLGIAVKNLNHPNLALSGFDRIRRVWVTGLSYHYGSVRPGIFSLDFRYKTDDYSFHAGVEQSLMPDKFFIRAGYEAGNDLQNFSGGLGLKVANRSSWSLSLDYAYTLSLDNDFQKGNGRHQITTEVRY